MKRILLYILILGLVLWMPVQGNDVGRLRPVQAILFYKEGGNFVLETDTEDRGVGESPMAAFANLKETTPAIIYLDTAEFLLVTEETAKETEPLRGVLKKTVRLCQVEEFVQPKAAAQFLRVNTKLPRLREWKYPEKLPKLEHFEERLKIIEKSENKG